MSSIFSGLSREERLLPIGDQQTLFATGEYKAIFLDAAHHPALYEHVDHHRRLQRVAQRTQQQYMHTLLRSTKLPVRRIAFPKVRAQTTAAPDTGSPPGAEASHTQRHDPSHTESSSTPAVSAPPLVAAQRVVRVNAPYERLVWPSLLQSPLVVPWVVESGPSSSTRSALDHDTLRELCAMAAQHSVPAQETILLYSLILTYLDVVVTSGVPIHALRWQEETAVRGVTADAQTEVAAHCRRVLWFQQLLLSAGDACRAEEDPQNRQAHTTLNTQTTTSPSRGDSRVETSSEAIADTQETEARWSVEPPRSFQALQARLTQLSAFFQVAATAPTQRTAPSAACLSHGSATPASQPMEPNTLPPPPQRHLPFAVLKLAARHWLERRGATVSATKLLGCAATAHTVRDLQSAASTDDDMPLHRRESFAPGATEVTEDRADKTTRAYEGEKESANPRATATMDKPASTPPPAPLRVRRADDEVCFLPCEPRTTRRPQSTFALPPLPCDPLVVFSVPVCHGALLTCMRDPASLLTLRERLLVETGAQCAALLSLREEQVRLQCSEEAHAEPETHAVGDSARSESGSLSRQRVESRTSFSVLLGSRTSSTTTTAPSVTRAAEALANLVFPLLTRDPLSSSFALYGPQAMEAHLGASAQTGASNHSGDGWRWNESVGWKGFEGWLLRCYDTAGTAPAPSASQHAVHPSSPASSAGPLRVRFMDVGLSLTVAQLPVSMEELADLCCRLGARLPRAQPHTRRPPLLQFNKLIQQWIMQVFQTHLLDIYLLCKRQRVQSFQLRAGHRGVALTLLQGDGKEEKVGTPGELSAEAHAAAAAAAAAHHGAGGGDGGGAFSLAALQLVAESGYEDAALWLKHVVDHMPERRGAVRQLQWSSAAALPEAHGTQESNGAIFVPTPPQGPSSTSASAGARPGTQTAAHDGRASPSAPQRTRHRVDVMSLRRAEESVLLRIFRCHPSAVYLAGCGVEQVMLDAMDGRLLLQRRCCGEVLTWELRDCYDMKLAGHPLRTPLCSVPTTPETTLPLPHNIPDAATRVGLAQMRGMLQYYHRSIVQSRKAASTKAVPADSVQCVTPGDDPNARLRSVHVTDPDTGDAGSATALAPSPAQLSQRQWPEAQRTALFPTDRAMAMFVLRHHPQYYTHVRGCGVVDVYVACLSRASRDDGPRASASSAADPGSALPAADDRQRSERHPVSASPVAASQATFLVARACGTLVPVALEGCYTARSPHVLLPPQQLAEVEPGLASSVPSTQRSGTLHYPTTRQENRPQTPSRLSLDLKRSRPW